MHLNHILYLKNILQHLVAISIPKVAKNGQKVPIFDNFEIRPVRGTTTYSCGAFCMKQVNFKRLKPIPNEN